MSQNHKIHIASAVGQSYTELAAFDNALSGCGVHNNNLIPLSSVIPPTAEIVVHDGRIPSIAGNWGDRLYVVMAEKRTLVPDEEIWAGIGWIQDTETKEGLFVEHTGHTEQEVVTLIHKSLQGLAENRGRDFGPVQYKLAGTVCDGTPTSVLAIAAYQVSDWQNTAHLL